MIVGVTGHRLQKMGGFVIPNPTYDYVVEETKKLLLNLKPDSLITGMAIGFDTICAELCIDLNIPFTAAIPFVGQESKWPQSSKDMYNVLLDKAFNKVIVNAGGYAAWKLQARNIYIVDNCDLLIAAFDGVEEGGTYNCIKYAKENNKEIRIIDLSTKSKDDNA